MDLSSLVQMFNKFIMWIVNNLGIIFVIVAVLYVLWFFYKWYDRRKHKDKECRKEFEEILNGRLR